MDNRSHLVQDFHLHKILFVFSILFSVLFAGCNASSPPDNNTNQTGLIAASILPIADWCRQITPDSIEVITIVPNNQNPHVYEPNVADMKRLSNANFIVCLGYGFDDWIQRTLSNLSNEDTPVLILENAEQESVHMTEDLHEHNHEHDHDHEGDHHHHEHNPHLWLDPVWAQEAVQIISNHLQEVFPDHSDEIEQKTQNYLLQLAQLHLKINQTLSELPHKSYVGYHGAFIPFSERYNLNEIATIEPWVGNEPSVEQIKKIVDALQSLEQPVIYIEPQLNPQKAKVLAEEVNSPVLVLDPIGDSTNPERDTYLELMNYNLNSFVEGLSGKNNSEDGSQ